MIIDFYSRCWLDSDNCDRWGLLCDFVLVWIHVWKRVRSKRLGRFDSRSTPRKLQRFFFCNSSVDHFEVWR
ncbi:hypothetical protein SDJN03_28504, partial [Cucurbita argyrosperma subsp. sororia]